MGLVMVAESQKVGKIVLLLRKAGKVLAPYNIHLPEPIILQAAELPNDLSGGRCDDLLEQ